MNARARSSPSPPGWTGLTIKEILERVDLFNVTMDVTGTSGGAADDGGAMKKKTTTLTDCFNQEEEDQTTDFKPLHQGFEKKTASSGKGGALYLDATDPSAAFLGPKLWDNPICLPLCSEGINNTASGPTAAGSVDPYSVMDMEDFLLENNLASIGGVQSESEEEKEPENSVQEELEDEDEEEEAAPPRKKARDGRTERNVLPKAENTFLYAESKRARAEREKVEKKKRRQMMEHEREMLIEVEEEETEVEFAPEDLALATIPGIDFDPRKRAFSVDELKPQPIIKKRKKNYVSFDAKDIKYWAKREKNNVAARRSREARRLKENQIALRAAFLEKENNALRMRLREAKAARDTANRECRAVRAQLSRFEKE